MAEEKTTLELISSVTEFNDLHEHLQDEEVDKTMGYVIKLITEPYVEQSKLGGLIVQLQAMSMKFGILATHYTVFDKGGVATEQGKRKHMYKTLNAELDKLVAALKYLKR